MYIPNDDTQNYPFSRLKLVVETFKHSTYYQPIKLGKVSTVVGSTNKKTILQNFGD